MNNDLLMNDTFENFNFTQNLQASTKTFPDEENKENTDNVQNENDIFFDDTFFMLQVSFPDENNVQKQEKEVHNERPEVQSEHEKVNITSVENILSESRGTVSESGNAVNNVSTFLSNELNSWGLPQDVLEKYESKNLKSMFTWQVECLSKPGVLEGKNLVYSAPTSAGKTLVAEIIAIKTIIERKKKVLFILPFVSIVREKMYYFQTLLETSGIRVDGFMGSYNPPGGFRMVQFAICTIEKANSLINRLLEEGKLNEIGAVLIDEIHLLGDSSRGYLLELLLTKLRYISKKQTLQIQIIGMSATLPNLYKLSEWLNAELYTTNYRPVPLNEQAHICGKIFDKNLELIKTMKMLPELTTDSDNILQLCLETIKDSCSVLIFCPTKNWCENLAQQIATGFFKIGSSASEWGALLRSQLDKNLIIELLEQLKYCPVGLDEILRKTVSFGVAFHHAGLTMDERDIIEGAFRNGALRVLVATSTLSSGVNLPARRVIIRTPIFHRKPLDALVYRQMIGRAGRMGKDTVGESFLICQKNEFKIAKELMSAQLPSVRSCLESGGKLKRAILEVVASGVASTPQDVKLFTESTLLSVENGGTNELGNPIDEAIEFLKLNEFIRLQKGEDGGEVYVASSLGKACLSSSIAPDEGLSLFTELERARQCLVLETELHLIYLVTPYSACYSWENIDWMFYLDLWEKLPASMKKVGELVGVREYFLINATRGKIQTSDVKYWVHKRFFVALALQDLVNEKPLSWVCSKFSCNRGMLQSLQQSASSFAGMVTAFSKQLGWSSMELLLSQFQERMQFGVSRDLIDLMHLPVLNGKMARSLFTAGIETVIQLANSEISTIENILHRVEPFESEKERDGESEYEKKQRNKYRKVWITGREGLTEREAAEIFVTEARKYLKIEMGLVDAQWKEKGEEEDEREGQEGRANLDQDDDKIEKNQCDKQNEVEVSKVAEENQIEENQHGKQNGVEVSKVLEESQISDISSDISNNIDISDSSIFSNTDSTKIEDDVEDCQEFIKETSNRLSEKLEKITITESEKSSESTNDISNLLKEISVSDFHETLSEPSKVVSDLISPFSVELNGSESYKMSISLEKVQSDQSLFEESFNLQLSDNDSSKKEDNQNECLERESFLQKAFSESFHSDDDIFGRSIEEKSQTSPVKKRKLDEKEESAYKKVKVVGGGELPVGKDLNETYVIDKLEYQPAINFSEMEVVNVCQRIELLEAFSKELSIQKSLSFSIACTKYTEVRCTIGQKVLRTQGPHLRNSDRKESKAPFTCDKWKVEGFSFSWDNNVAYYLSLDNVKLHAKILKLLKATFKNPDVTVAIFDSKEQLKLISKCFGVNFSCKIDDPKIADWILDPEGEEKNLGAMTVKYCPEGTELSQLSGGCRGVGSISLDIYSTVDAKIRSSLEAILTWHLTDSVKNVLRQRNLKYLNAYDIEMSVIVILAKMEVNGMCINKNSLISLLDTLKCQISSIEKTAYSKAGRNFNFSSSADVAKVTGLYRGRKVSTRKQILEKNPHPISDLVLQWRKLHLIQTKTVYPLIQAIVNDRIHGCYITHTATGRITMHEPNLQSITKDFTVDGYKIVNISCREIFQAPEEWELVSADYCQLELRILTHFSQDQLLCKIMREPGDVFKIIAAEWNRIKEEEVTESLRQNVKHLCYGIIYGMGSKTLSEQLNVEETEAVEFMETFRNTYPGIKSFVKATIESCRKCGYVETISGRRRFLPHINDTEQAKKGQAERQAVNTIIQGSAADIVKKSMIKVEKELGVIFHKTKNKPKMVLHLHDELIYEVPCKYLKKVARIVKKNMENSVELSIPFPVKLKSGKSWGTMTEMTL